MMGLWRCTRRAQALFSLFPAPGPSFGVVDTRKYTPGSFNHVHAHSRSFGIQQSGEQAHRCTDVVLRHDQADKRFRLSKSFSKRQSQRLVFDGEAIPKHELAESQSLPTVVAIAFGQSRRSFRSRWIIMQEAFPKSSTPIGIGARFSQASATADPRSNQAAVNRR